MSDSKPTRSLDECLALHDAEREGSIRDAAVAYARRWAETLSSEEPMARDFETTVRKLAAQDAVYALAGYVRELEKMNAEKAAGIGELSRMVFSRVDVNERNALLASMTASALSEAVRLLNVALEEKTKIATERYKLRGEVKLLREELDRNKYTVRTLLPPGVCFSTPDGACVGHGCMHDPLTPFESGASGGTS